MGGCSGVEERGEGCCCDGGGHDGALEVISRVFDIRGVGLGVFTCRNSGWKAMFTCN